ncbi:hypothetical protein BKA82DRAFT_567161 [Pisolithus tinctorius]|uniref:Uncharacterized protein n=1 Tax=Pisolithus tinctorius Marx 270 TaxID=870435 RepID=A0A0C3JVW2_PISTI|nr:hypothetical protein BKA82DRAFT_567161 [Pisolithus tinctorius]KIO13258.1 hypothetical protein M404DRAFT_567161 [Pisolithus tinctorius Marx 270]
MGGPNLEVFKFGLYLFVPVMALLHFGDPQWYHSHVLPYKEQLFPRGDKTHMQLPTDQATVKAELIRIKAEKLARKQEREKAAQEHQTPQPDVSSQTSRGWFRSWW